MSEFEYYMKEDVFHNNHTTRHGVHQEGHGKETTMTIDRPLHKDSRVTTKYYSEFDEYLMENKTATEPIINGYCYQIPKPIPVKMPKEEIIAKLEAHCLSKKKKYDSWSNTSTVTYTVPSTFEVSVRDVKDSNFVERVNPSYSMINGKLYDRDFIYERNYWTATDLQAVCPLKIAQPLLKNPSNNTVDKRLVPLKISSLSSHLSNLNYYRGSWFEHSSREQRPHQGILQHDVPWCFENSRQVVNDLFIDLGTAQQVTHIGTVGSYPPTVVYPAPTKSQTRGRGNKTRDPQDAHKYNTSVLLVDDPSHEQSWPVSYRLFYRNTLTEDYRFAGNYRANMNSHGLVVNDVSEHLSGVSARYLMLKIVSNQPYTFRGKYNHPVRMSVAVYGRESVSPKPRVMLKDFTDAASSAPAVIKYTLSIPHEKKCDRGVEVKQMRVSHKVGGGGSGARRYMGKRGLKQATAEEAAEARMSPLFWEAEKLVGEEEDHCYTSAEEDEKETAAAIAAVSRAEAEEQLQLDLLLNVPTGDSSFWDPVIPYELQQGSLSLEDESQWPALPGVAGAASATAVADAKLVIVKSDVEGTTPTGSSSLVCESTDSEHTAMTEEVVEEGVRDVTSDDEWMLV